MTENIQDPQNTPQIPVENKPKSASLMMLEKLDSTVKINSDWLREVRLAVGRNTEAYQRILKQLDEVDKFVKLLQNKNEQVFQFYSDLHKNVSRINEGFLKEHQLRAKFLESIPTEVKTKLSSDNVAIIEQLNKKAFFIKFFLYFGLGFFLFGFVDFFFVNKLAAEWYSESVKSRQEMLNDYQLKGNTIVSIRMLDSLKQNTEMVKQFVNQNPKDAQNFINFAKGFHAKK